MRDLREAPNGFWEWLRFVVVIPFIFIFCGILEVVGWLITPVLVLLGIWIMAAMWNR